MRQPPKACPLCQNNSNEFYYADSRNYWQCSNCDLVFVSASEHLSESEEKSRYDFHENDSNDPGYRAFLGRLINPLSECLPKASEGLDFGCGPGPTVSVMLEEQGHTVACYDKYYANTPALLGQKYDFVTSTEVLEHLREPREEIERLIGMLKSEGYLGIMTKLLPPTQQQFANWHYKKDPTHICFYADSTFEWIASHWNLSLKVIGRDVLILQSGN